MEIKNVSDVYEFLSFALYHLPDLIGSIPDYKKTQFNNLLTAAWQAASQITQETNLNIGWHVNAWNLDPVHDVPPVIIRRGGCAFGNTSGLEFVVAHYHVTLLLIKSVNFASPLLAILNSKTTCRHLPCNQEILEGSIYCVYHHLEALTGFLNTEPPVLKRRSKKIDQDFENLGG
jgi:hypothetical protein